MKGKILRKMTVLMMGFSILSGGALGMNPKISEIPIRKVSAKTRKPVTKTNHLTMKVKKTRWIGLGKAGICPKTTDWKSSNSKIATVMTKGDSEGAHKVTAKKKGKVTISCKVSKTSGSYVKGDIYKWISTVK